MAVNVFAVPVFLVVFRESLEAVIIVSVLLAFLKQTLDGPNGDIKMYKRLRRQIWLGTGIGFFICMIISAALIGVFYTVGTNSWDKNEYYYEGAFCLFAALIITVMGAALLRIGKMQVKWRVKLAKSLAQPIKMGSRGWLKEWTERNAMFILPFITVLREGIEAVVFVSGVTFTSSAKSIPLPTVVGLIAGGLVGYLLYKGGSTARIQLFLVASTCLLYLVAAGLFSRGVWDFEQQKWNEFIGGEASEFGAGAGSYDIDQSVWHVNCCAPNIVNNGGWNIFTAILGWTNSATYGSVISYNLYWIFVAAGFMVMRFKEVNGRYPMMKAKPAAPATEPTADNSSDSQAGSPVDKGVTSEKTTAV
ncbi:putative iron transferase [Ilyonectria robusta]|uniref:putative iron transferase n=1 Tax=Ilyonectria robusta TaxID=1079257 RepID=UPI001E8D9A54|nr:putative iron transferase [Ilyonectria robusta]KAH6974254.1 putative iron transferase [Ilyonectria sp. MPI-CAGE-AT-0026]KAH8666202.1 putative iron transferase [Ilyonectria robusta]